jgi:uncharacterized protein (DUF2249 family)
MIEKIKVEIPMTTLEFLKYEENGLTYYEFDATQCQPPEPMVNTIHGLKQIKSNEERLVGIFFHEPTPLYTKIEEFFEYNAVELDNGDFRLEFKRKV